MADGSGGAYSLRSDWSDHLSIKLFANGQLLIWFTNVIGFAQKAIMSQQTRMDNFLLHSCTFFEAWKIQPQFILIGWKNKFSKYLQTRNKVIQVCNNNNILIEWSIHLRFFHFYDWIWFELWISDKEICLTHPIDANSNWQFWWATI